MFRKLVLVIGAAALLSAAAWQHDATAGIEEPPVCGHFAAGAIEEPPGGVAGGPGTGLNFATGFEPEEDYPLGYISNASGTHPLGCGGPAFPCWGHTTAANASLITPTIENINPADGLQHLRLIYDPSTRTNTTGFGLGVDARYPRAADLSVRPVAPSTTSADLAISNPGGMNFRYQNQSNSQGCIQGSVLFYEDGEIYVLDDFCGTEGVSFQPTGHFWDTTGGYKNFTWSNNPCTDTQNYYYDGQLIYSGCVFFGSNLEQFLVFGDNYPGSHMDVDNVVMSSLDECPHTCGNGVIEYGYFFEQCEVTPGGDANCPDRCIAAGQPGECTCTPICTLENPCSVENGANGPFLSSSGYYFYTGNSPFVSVDGCGTNFDARLTLRTPSSTLISNENCQLGGSNGTNSDPTAPCYVPSGAEPDPCTCVAIPNEPILISLLRSTSTPPLGSTSYVNIRKKAACAGPSVGACCDTNGPDQGCTENVTADNCMGADKIWTDQGKCEDLVCDCILDCTGAACGSDGCGGSCGTCDDGNRCNGLESCNLDRTCRPGIPLVCDDGAYCNGMESCVPSFGCLPGTSPCNLDETCMEETDTCETNAIPAVSEWGLLVLALVLLVAAKIRFAPRRA